MGNNVGTGGGPGSAFKDEADDPARYVSSPNILKLTRADFQLPLTEREVFKVTRSWKTISKNMVNTGVVMFLKMFGSNPKVKEMFEQFRSSSNVNDLTGSQALEAHALLVMNTLDESFSNLDDETYLVEMLLTTGKMHRRFEDFNAVIFWAIEEAFLGAVRDTLGPDRYPPPIERLYRRSIRFILAVLIVGFTQAINEVRSSGGRGSV